MRFDDASGRATLYSTMREGKTSSSQDTFQHLVSIVASLHEKCAALEQMVPQHLTALSM